MDHQRVGVGWHGMRSPESVQATADGKGGHIKYNLRLPAGGSYEKLKRSNRLRPQVHTTLNSY